MAILPQPRSLGRARAREADVVLASGVSNIRNMDTAEVGTPLTAWGAIVQVLPVLALALVVESRLFGKIATSSSSSREVLFAGLYGVIAVIAGLLTISSMLTGILFLSGSSGAPSKASFGGALIAVVLLLFLVVFRPIVNLMTATAEHNLTHFGLLAMRLLGKASAVRVAEELRTRRRDYLDSRITTHSMFADSFINLYRELHSGKKSPKWDQQFDALSSVWNDWMKSCQRHDETVEEVLETYHELSSVFITDDGWKDWTMEFQASVAASYAKLNGIVASESKDK